MKHELIKIENYLLAVDELKEPVKEGQTLLSKEGIIHTNIGWNYGDKIILAHLPLNGSPYLDGVDVLPEIGYEVEKLASKWAIDNADETMETNSALNKGFKAGYNKAKETYKYTKKDLSKAIRMYLNKKTFEEIIQYLNQPKLPVTFECEMMTGYYNESDVFINDGESKIKKINSEGKIQWLGKYEF